MSRHNISLTGFRDPMTKERSIIRAAKPADNFALAMITCGNLKKIRIELWAQDINVKRAK